MADKKEKKFLIDNPTLMAEWNWEKNNELGLDPKTLTLGSNKKAWWKCSKGHEWQAIINSRTKGSGCPYCAGQKAIKGYNDLATINPKLASEWNYEKNDGLTPMDIMPNSNKKVWWKCSKGHEWQATIIYRNKRSGCPICSNKKVLVGVNDLATINPQLAKEWNYEKNGDLKPEDFTANSGKKVWWKCSRGHEWQTTIDSRSNGIGCPYCAGRNVIKGKNDLKTLNPNLASEWNYEKNGDLKPENFTANSGKKVWWKCNKGHEWQATVGNRNKGRDCPICTSERTTSFPEFAIVYYLKKNSIETIHSYKEKGYELDIYIPSRKIAIEYDGCFWHKNKEKKDLEKNLKCKNDGIILYRIREDLPSLNDYSIDYIVDKCQRNLGEVIQKVISEIVGANIDVDLKRDAIEIEDLREYTEKANSLLYINPTLASEWNYEKNGSLKPEHILANSHKKVWWKCSEGHEWIATIASRNSRTGCPYCSGRYAIKGVSDLATINPKLVKEWNYEKNGNLKPEDFMPNSNKKVWWKCEKGHEWQATINHRNKGGGCAYCAGQKAITGYNDLATLNPKLASEWNNAKNGDLAPKHFMPNSGKKVWWKCFKGHEWQATISTRNRGSGCPYCSNQKILRGYNDLATINPKLASEWNYEKNGNLKPEDFTANSGKKVWWKCEKGHEWEATIVNRNRGRGCPYCSGRKK
ncbi:MAG: hypothetical protein IKJ19_05000 [Clostridia bacterium]|nr:hypothetical protein [Clostridia bacterium]